jgi:hypothetical protein
VVTVNAVFAFQKPDDTTVWTKRTGGSLKEIEAAILVQCAGVVGYASSPVPETGLHDRIFRRANYQMIRTVNLAKTHDSHNRIAHCCVIAGLESPLRPDTR